MCMGVQLLLQCVIRKIEVCHVYGCTITITVCNEENRSVMCMGLQLLLLCVMRKIEICQVRVCSYYCHV